MRDSVLSHKRSLQPSSFVSRDVNSSTLTTTAAVYAAGLPTPWPLGLFSLVLSIVTGYSNYKFTLPNESGWTHIGRAVTVLRSIALGLSSLIAVWKGDYTPNSTDGFLALFTNVVSIMAAGQDYEQRTWAIFGFIAMAIGLVPRLMISFLSTVDSPFGPGVMGIFTWSASNAPKCIVSPNAFCSDSPNINNLACKASLEQDSPFIVNVLDIIRGYSWTFGIFIIAAGCWRMFRGNGRVKTTSKTPRRIQVTLAWLTLVFSFSAVGTSAIVYAISQAYEAMDCTDLQTCQPGVAISCPPVILKSPQTSNGFFQEWTQSKSIIDVLGAFA